MQRMIDKWPTSLIRLAARYCMVSLFPGSAILLASSGKLKYESNSRMIRANMTLNLNLSWIGIERSLFFSAMAASFMVSVKFCMMFSFEGFDADLGSSRRYFGFNVFI